MTDETLSLLRAIQRGEPDAERAFFERFFEFLERRVRPILGAKYSSIQGGEDVSLMAINSFIMRARKGEYAWMLDPQDPRSWLIRIACNKALTVVRDERRQGRDQTLGESDLPPGFSEIGEFLAEFSAAESTDGVHQRGLVECSETIQLAWEMLSERERWIVEQSYAGKRNHEIAAELGVADSTILRTLEKILDRWRRRFGS